MIKKFYDRETIKNWFYENQNKIYSAIAEIENFKVTTGETDKIIGSYLNNEIPELKNVSLNAFFMIIGIWKAYKNHYLNFNMSNEVFIFDVENIKDINSLIGNYEDSRCGKIRTHQVILKNINYLPPAKWEESEINQKLNEIVNKINELNSLNKTQELLDFIFKIGTQMIKEQWFPNGNNRTASLFINIVLLHSGIGFFYVQNEKVTEYKRLRNNFYENQDEQPKLIEFMKNECLVTLEKINELNNN